ncbi:MAG: sigma-70 family RNA polymerase sigma factor [Oscillospiraceae bacterium]|jgi:DNA-directed RNA polymerase sigma subunit (sigma70/sigma32)|nr:sigma-70 family RNA polymerase sigma factor [Oscillospiraceae bacterium]
MQTNDNQKYIYIRSTRERIPVTEEEFDNYYRDINAFRKKQQRHGRCVCPEAKRLDCDMDCDTCPFRRAGDHRSLDVKVAGGESWLDEYPDCGPTPNDLLEDRELLDALRAVLAELTDSEQDICRVVMADLSERAAAAELNITREAFTYRRNKLFARLKNILKNFI